MRARIKRLTTSLCSFVILSLTCVALGADKIPVFVGFNKTPGPSEQAWVHAHGGDIRYSYQFVPAIAASIPEAAIQGIMHNPNVAYIEPVIEVFAVVDEVQNTWGVDRIDAERVHAEGNFGFGVKVAIIDSGVDYNHEDLRHCFNDTGLLGYDFVNSDTDPMDDAGHGTHVAGTVAANYDGVGVVGVAPGVTLYALKVLGANGGGYTDDIVAAFDWIAAYNTLHPDSPIAVTNNSYGSSIDPGETLFNAIERCPAIHVCAAGNSGNKPGKGDNVIYPARYESTIAVAATDSSDRRASFSSTGPAVDISAPGVGIRSTLLGGGYGLKSGTSMASPHVAGTVALMLASGDFDIARLTGTAIDLGAIGKDPLYGWGLVDAYAAAPPAIEDFADIAILEVSAPSSASPAEKVDVKVTVGNTGTLDVTQAILVTLSDGSVILPSQTIAGLLPGVSQILTFSWTVPNNDGEYSLTASHDFGDAIPENNSKTTTVTVGSSGNTMSASIAMLPKTAGPNVNAVAMITVTSSSGPVAGATVSGQWSGLTSDSDSGVTDDLGKVTFNSNKLRNVTGTFTFTVDSIVKAGWTWDGSGSTGSITVP